jgi:dihydroorotase
MGDDTPLIIRGGRVIDAANNIDQVGDLLIDEGRIVSIGDAGEQLPLGAPCVIDASGSVVAPGFVDVHAHLRVPGFEYKEDLASGTAAAAAGGFTTVCAMPNTDPVIDSRSVMEGLQEEIEQHATVRVFTLAAITLGQNGQQLVEMVDLAEAGVVGFTDDGKPLANTSLMRHALEYARPLRVPVSNHCEDPSLTAGTTMHEGIVSARLGLQGTPRQAEEIMLARDLRLAELTGGRYHCLHVTSGGSADLIRQSKSRGAHVTAEVTPHHLTLTCDLVAGRSDPVSAALPPYDGNTKVAPPLREQLDADRLLEALLDGTIDCIATDHAPHAMHEKDIEYADAAAGFSAFETALQSVLSLVHAGAMELSFAVRMLTSAPARVYGLPYGTLTPGAPADVTIFDPDEETVVDPSTFRSKGHNTPLAGLPMQGVIQQTIVGGAVVYNRATATPEQMHAG